MIHSNAWRELRRTDVGFLNTLSGVFASVERRNPNAFPNLRRAESLFVASDYGGEHGGAKYQTIAFLLADIANCAAWQIYARASSRQWTSGASYRIQDINDGVRARSLNNFLSLRIPYRELLSFSPFISLSGVSLAQGINLIQRPLNLSHFKPCLRLSPKS